MEMGFKPSAQYVFQKVEPQRTFTCPMPTLEELKKSVKYVQS